MPSLACWVWVDNLGLIEQPIRSWSNVEARLGESADRVRRHALNGAIGWMLLSYTRGGEPSVLLLRVNRAGGELRVLACGALTPALRPG